MIVFASGNRDGSKGGGMETLKFATVGQFGRVAESESEKEKTPFAPESKRSWWISALCRYGVALLLTGAAFLVRTLLTPVIGGEGPYLFFSPAALLAAWYGGRGPGTMASLLGVVLGDYFFAPPLHEFGPYGPAEVTLIATYLLGTLVGVMLFDLLQRSRQRLQVSVEHERIAAGQARERSLELEREIAEHRRTESALESARSELAAINNELEERITSRTADLQESL